MEDESCGGGLGSRLRAIEAALALIGCYRNQDTHLIYKNSIDCLVVVNSGYTFPHWNTIIEENGAIEIDDTGTVEFL